MSVSAEIRVAKEGSVELELSPESVRHALGWVVAEAVVFAALCALHML